jgi:hypothetical protein
MNGRHCKGALSTLLPHQKIYKNKYLCYTDNPYLWEEVLGVALHQDLIG